MKIFHNIILLLILFTVILIPLSCSDYVDFVEIKVNCNLIEPTDNQIIYTNKPTFQWESALGADTYLIYIDNVFITESYELGFTLNDEQALTEGNHSWKAISKNEFQYMPCNRDVPFTVIIPGEAGLLTPINGECVKTNTPTFNWKNTNGIVSNKIEIASDENFTNIILSAEIFGAETFTAEYLENGFYYWRVFSTDENGKIYISETFDMTITNNFIVANDLLVPQPVDINTITDTSQIVFKWSGEVLASPYSYEFELSKDDFQTYLIRKSDLFEPQYIVTNSNIKIEDGIYQWRARTVFYTCPGDWCNKSSFICDTKCKPEPSIPKNLIPPVGDCSTTSYTFTWDGGVAGDEYIVEISTDSTAWSNKITKTGICVDGVNSFTVEINTAGGYYWQVKHSNSCGTSGFITQTIPFNTGINAGIPTNLSTPTIACSGSVFNFSWDGGIAGDSYTVEISMDSTSWTDPISFTGTCATGTNSVSTAINRGGLYSWRVKMSNSCSDSGFVANTARFSVGGIAVGWIDGVNPGWKQTSGIGSINNSTGVTLDSSGFLWVTSVYSNRIDKYDTDGTYLSSHTGASIYLPQSVFINKTDTNGYIYVSDSGNYRICKWDSNGNAIGWIGGGSDGWKTGTTAGAQGNTYQSFNFGATGGWTSRVQVDNSGNIYVCDVFNHRISRWFSNGNADGWIGGGTSGWKQTNGATIGTGLYSFNYPVDVSFDNWGYLYIADQNNHRVIKYEAVSGSAIGWIGGGSDGWKTLNSSPAASNDYRAFNRPVGSSIDENGDMYITDYINRRLTKWDKDGNAIGWIGGGDDGWKETSGGSSTNDYRSFIQPSFIYVDDNYIYIADGPTGKRVCKWCK